MPGSLVCTVPPGLLVTRRGLWGGCVLHSFFCKHYSSHLHIPGFVQADFIVFVGHSWVIRETRRACGSCVAGMHSLWSAFNPIRSCCVQAFFFCFAFPRRKFEIISDFTVLNYKNPRGWRQRMELPIQPSILRGIFSCWRLNRCYIINSSQRLCSLMPFLLKVRASHFLT